MNGITRINYINCYKRIEILSGKIFLDYSGNGSDLKYRLGNMNYFQFAFESYRWHLESATSVADCKNTSKMFIGPGRQSEILQKTNLDKQNTNCSLKFKTENLH